MAADDLKKCLLKPAEERLQKDSGDKWALEVFGRLQGIIDLVPKEALLHKRCNTNFIRGSTCKADGGSGRKKEDERIRLFEQLCDWLEGEMEHSLLTLQQVYQKLLALDPSPDKSLSYSKRYLKDKLEEKYNDRLYFTSQERRSDVLCFKDLTADILREHNQNVDDDEKTKIIKSAVRLVKNDIALVNLNSTVYPSLTDMTDENRQSVSIPDSIKLLLKPLLKTDQRVAFWGQSLIRACRPRSGVLPLPLRLSLQIDHRFGSNRIALLRVCRII